MTDESGNQPQQPPSDNPNDPNLGPRIAIKAEDSVAMGRFCNFAQIGHQADAFMMDFAFIQGSAGWLLARTLMSPSHAKRFYLALGDNLARYEASFGEIPATPTLQ
ncbi:MAG: DUF3467 domain-containing protein [Deltaproteobacteria bacterium]|nr:DUF3467 domain-containing protein [Deltaproteobacteria bacterium]